MKKKDLFFLGIVIVAAIFMLAAYFFTQKTGSIARIILDGRTIMEVGLDENQVIEVPFDDASMANELVVEDGYIYMKSANCRDELCVHMGKICRENESIICLPHKLIIEIDGEGDVDAVAR